MNKLRMLLVPFLLITINAACAQQSGGQKEQEFKKAAEEAKKRAAKTQKLKPRKDGLVPVNPQQTVLVDLQKKRVILNATVCNRDALLEMLLVRKERKQHEGILALDALALDVHQGLLAIGAKPGSPTKWAPYKKSYGQEIDIFVSWTDKKGKKHRRRAQEWMHNSVQRYHSTRLKSLPLSVRVPFDELRYDRRNQELLWFGPMSDKQYDSVIAMSKDNVFRDAVDKLRGGGKIKQMDAKFIFAGSFFFDHPEFGRMYTAEGGYVICVANLPEAVIDINIVSSDADGSQLFEAWTERIPPEGTKITVELIPVPGYVPPKHHKDSKQSKSATAKSPAKQSGAKTPAEQKSGQ